MSTEPTEKNIGEDRPELRDHRPSPRFMIQDYWVDLSGGLLPGTLFCVAALSSILPSTTLLFNSLSIKYKQTIWGVMNEVLDSVQHTPNTIWLAMTAILFSLFYVLGHMFYRQDPKLPNELSFRHLEKVLKEKENYNEEEFKNILKNELACTSEEDCEFPFPYFDDYLRNRGLYYLIPFVAWSKNREHRTKNFINILKIRLRFYFPNRCGTIIKNEAHVRLASSTWYVGKALVLCCILAMIITFISFFIYYLTYYSTKVGLEINDDFYAILSQHIGALFISGLIWGIAFYVRKKVEYFLHYQRMREVVHVMETAWTAFQYNIELLSPPFDMTKAIVDEDHKKA